MAEQFLASAVEDNNPVSFANSKYGSGVFGLGFTEAKRIIMAFLRGNKKTMHGGG